MAVVAAGIVVVVGIAVVVDIVVEVAAGIEVGAGVGGNLVRCTEEVVGIEVEGPLAGWLGVVGVFRHQLP